MSEQTPSWAHGLAVVGTESRGARTETAPDDAARIADAKARAMERSKLSNRTLGEQFGDLPIIASESHYKDFCGPETSEYEFERLVHLLYFFQHPRVSSRRSTDFPSSDFGPRSSLDTSERAEYNPRTGFWSRGGARIHIDEIKKAVAERIAELGISELLVLEHLATPHTIAEDRAFHGLTFEEQMQRFKK